MDSPGDASEDEDEVALDITKPSSAVDRDGKAVAALAPGAAGPSPFGSRGLGELWPLLHELAELRGVEYAEVTLEARQMIITHQLPSRRQHSSAVEQLLTAMGDAQERLAGGPRSDASSVGDDALAALVEDQQPLLDELLAFFGHAKVRGVEGGLGGSQPREGN